MAYVALIGIVIAGLGILWWTAGKTPSRGRPTSASGAPLAGNRTLLRAGSELAGQSVAAPPTAAEPLPVAPAPAVSLLDAATLAPSVALALTALADALPRPRSVMLQLVHAGDDPSELARVVATDPATAALLLRTVNSAQFALAQEITSVPHAITYLGANLVRDVALHHAMAVPVDTRNLTAERIYQALWRDSYLASGLAHTLAQRLGWPSPSLLSTQALLYRLGDIALVSHHPQIAGLYGAEPDLSELVDHTQQQLGFNSAMIGAHLAQVWGLPGALRGVLRHSLAPLAGGPQTLEDGVRFDVAVAYFTSRLAQALTRQVTFDLPAALADALHRPEAHYVPQYLAEIGIADPRVVLSEPALDRKVAALVMRGRG